MTTALWCVLVAALLPFLFTGLAKASKRFDNAAPRDYFEQSTGWRKRAHWAQLNRSEEHTSELQSLMRISYAVFCLKKKIQPNTTTSANEYPHLIPTKDTILTL